MTKSNSAFCIIVLVFMASSASVSANDAVCEGIVKCATKYVYSIGLSAVTHGMSDAIQCSTWQSALPGMDLATVVTKALKGGKLDTCGLVTGLTSWAIDPMGQFASSFKSAVMSLSKTCIAKKISFGADEIANSISNAICGDLSYSRTRGGSVYCPQGGYTNHGLYCVRFNCVAEMFGTCVMVNPIPETAALRCGSGQDIDGGKCWVSCKPGYKGVGPVCWRSKS